MASEGKKYEAHGEAVFLGKDCIALTDTDVSPKAVNEARAKLFAAAPEMLHLIRDLTANMANDGGEYRDCHRQAVELIARLSPAEAI